MPGLYAIVSAYRHSRQHSRRLMTQPTDDQAGVRPAGASPGAPTPPDRPSPSGAPPDPIAIAPALSAAEVQQVVEEGRRRFVASFPGRFELLTVLIETAGGGDTDALADL